MQSLVDVKSKNTWKKVNRRFRGKLPGAKKLPRMDLLIGIDSSGSMSDEDLKKVYTEVDAINDTGMCSIEIAVFDTDIHQREEYHKGFEAKRICSGGTSFIPVHELAIAERYKGVIYLTDGYADFPNKDEVTYKCLWVINNTHVKPPYGQTIRIK
jgi:predicted metal-dependent peptidase